jgi:hypothetical protein
MRFGKGSRLYNSETGLERFKTTVFIVLFCFPFVPAGTYLVERTRILPDDVIVLEKLRLDWEQILGRGGRLRSSFDLAHQDRFF